MRIKGDPLASREQRPTMNRTESPMCRMLRAVCAITVALLVSSFLPGAIAQQKPAPATIRMVPIPIANYTPILVGRDKGYFADENLTVTWAPVMQGAVAIEAVFGGSAEVGGSAVFEPMVARGNGLDLMFIAAGVQIRNQPPDNSALLVRADDSIRAPADLAGKKIS